MKTLPLLIVCGLAASPPLFASYGIDVALRYGDTDTGYSTQRTTSPEITAFQTLGGSDANALGLTYVNFHWDDSTSWSLGRAPLPDEYTGGSTTGKVQWDALMLSYRVSIPLAAQWAFIIEPRLGTARAHGSGLITLDGGLAGRSSQTYSFSTGWGVAGEVQSGLAWQPVPGCKVRLGLVLSRYQISGANHPLAGSLSSAQGVIGAGFNF
jgi:hypothetical protein